MLNLIFKNLLRRKTRTLLTAAGIAVGVSMIVALGAMGEGIRTGYASMFGGSGSDLTMMQKGSYDITLSSIDEETIGQVAALSGVHQATGLLVGNVTAPGAPYFFVFGYDPKGFAIQRFQIIEGQGFSSSAQSARLGSRAILMGKQAAEAMKLKIGDAVRLTGGTFRVAGIYTSGSGFEDAAAIVALIDAQQLLMKQRLVSAVQIKLEDPRAADRVRSQLQKLYPRLTITQSSQTGDQQQMVAYIQGFAIAIALLAIVIGGIGMTNTVMMSTFERTSEIGTLRALGWGRRRVLLMVLGESVVLSAIGGVIGCGLGALLITALQANSALVFLQGKLTIDLFAIGLLTALVLGASGGIYPAWRASKLLPIEALRYQGGGGKDARRVTWLKWETLRSLWRRRGRTLMTMAGISLALMSIALLVGMADGFIVMFDQLMAAADTDLIARQADTSDLAYSAIDERIGRQIATLPGVQSVSGIVVTALSTDEVPLMMLWGYAPHERAIEHFKIVEGRTLDGNHELMLGRPMADLLKTKIGEVVRLGEVGFRVVGIYETGISYEESSVVIPLRDAQTLIGKLRQVTLYAIKLIDPLQIDVVQRQIGGLTDQLDVSPSQQFSENMPDMERVRAMVWAISALAIIVGGIGMTNTMVMSVYERTREIGTLRALGWRRRGVLLMILKESIALALLGAAAGFILALILGWLLQLIPMWGNFLLIQFSPGSLAQLVVVAVLLGVIGGLYPAWRASNLRPVEALHYE